MSLVYCPECNGVVSTKAISCPKCGFPVKESIAKAKKEEGCFPQVLGYSCLLVLFCFIVFILLIILIIVFA